MINQTILLHVYLMLHLISYSFWFWFYGFFWTSVPRSSVTHIAPCHSFNKYIPSTPGSGAECCSSNLIIKYCLRKMDLSNICFLMREQATVQFVIKLSLIPELWWISFHFHKNLINKNVFICCFIYANLINFNVESCY